jgi:hypothetical protein
MKKTILALVALAFAGSAMAVDTGSKCNGTFVCDPVMTDAVTGSKCNGTFVCDPTIDSASTTDPTEPFAGDIDPPFA